MSKKRVPRAQDVTERTRGSEAQVLFRFPEGYRVETPKPGDSANKVSDPVTGVVVEVNYIAMFKRFAQLRKKIGWSSSDPVEQEFVDLWRRGLHLRARLRRVRTHPKKVWTSAEVWALIWSATEAGFILKRLESEYGGLVGEMVKRAESLRQSNENLAKAKKAREAGLTSGLKHKLRLMCEYEAKISRRTVARRLIEESEEDNLRCHHCQGSKWVSHSEDVRFDVPCEYRRRYGKCQKCEECTLWYAYFSKWRKSAEERLSEKKLSEDEIKKRMCEALAKRIGNVDPRPTRPGSTRKVRRGVPRG